MLFLVGGYRTSKSGVYMALNDAMAFDCVKEAIEYADNIGHAYVAQIRPGHEPNIVYETED